MLKKSTAVKKHFHRGEQLLEENYLDINSSVQNRMMLFFVSRESVLPVSKRKTHGLLLPLRNPLTMLVWLHASVQQVRQGHAPMHSQ